MEKATYQGSKETHWWDPYRGIIDRIKNYRLKKRAIQETRHSHNNPGEVKYGETHRPAEVTPIEQERAWAERNDKRMLLVKFRELKAAKRYQQRRQEEAEQERLRRQEQERARLAEERRLRGRH